MFSKIKDKVSSIAAKSFLESKLGEAGEIQELSIDSRSKKFSIVLLLKGEPASIAIDVANYRILEDTEGSLVEIGEIQSSRRWIEMLLAGRKIKVPKIVAKIL